MSLNGDVWHDLLSFVPVICSYRNVSSAWLLKRLDAGGASPEDEPSHPNVARMRSPKAPIAAATSSKLEDGNISAAARILCSEDTLAEFSAANLTKFKVYMFAGFKQIN